MLENVSVETLFKPLFELLSEIRERDTMGGSKKPQFALIESFWHIGRLIVENEQGGEKKALYGDYLVERLAKELTLTFGKGYNQTNIRWARQLYVTYSIRHTSSDKLDLTCVLNNRLSWSHYRTLLKISNIPERDFYIEQIAANNWSVRFLKKMIAVDFYTTRQGGFRLPSPTSGSLQAASLRLLKAKSKAVGFKIKGWSFIHPTSFPIDNKDLLFYHIIKRHFVYLSHSKPVSGWEEVFKKQLTETYGLSAVLSVFSFVKDKQLTLLSSDDKEVAKNIKAEFNGLS